MCSAMEELRSSGLDLTKGDFSGKFTLAGIGGKDAIPYMILDGSEIQGNTGTPYKLMMKTRKNRYGVPVFRRDHNIREVLAAALYSFYKLRPDPNDKNRKPYYKALGKQKHWEK